MRYVYAIVDGGAGPRRLLWSWQVESRCVCVRVRVRLRLRLRVRVCVSTETIVGVGRDTGGGGGGCAWRLSRACKTRVEMLMLSEEQKGRARRGVTPRVNAERGERGVVRANASSHQYAMPNTWKSSCSSCLSSAIHED